jgi:hypothetical protein
LKDRSIPDNERKEQLWLKKGYHTLYALISFQIRALFHSTHFLPLILFILNKTLTIAMKISSSFLIFVGGLPDKRAIGRAILFDFL